MKKRPHSSAFSQDNTRNKEGHIALVTGANRGLGLEISKQLGDLGYTVLLGCRNQLRAEEAERKLRAAGSDCHALVLDVVSPPSITAAYKNVERRFGRLDVLVNNAAIHYDDWENSVSVEWDVVQEALNANALGPWRVAIEMLPLLKQSRHPRIVNVSSEAGSTVSMSGATPAYSISKAALNAITIMLARQLRRERFLVNAVCPGWTATDMGGLGGRPVQEGAKGIVWAATLSDDGPTGVFFRDGRELSW